MKKREQGLSDLRDRSRNATQSSVFIRFLFTVTVSAGALGLGGAPVRALPTDRRP